MIRWFYTWQVTFKDGYVDFVEEQDRRRAIIRANVLHSRTHGRAVKANKV